MKVDSMGITEAADELDIRVFMKIVGSLQNN